jgi:hypothetical protein
MPQFIPDPGFPSTQDCIHGTYELRRRTYANGVIHFVYQCLFCGASGRSIKKEEALGVGGANAPEFDDGLRERFYEEAREKRQAGWEVERQRRREEYRDYLDSPEWRHKRNRRLVMDRWQCQARLDGCLDHASEVHHLTYAHIGNEPLFDLVSVCGPCHRKISAMDGSIQEERAVYVAAS